MHSRRNLTLKDIEYMVLDKQYKEDLAIFQAELAAFVEENAKNGIKQHSDEWLHAKLYTIGGSQIASIIGKNARGGLNSIINDKVSDGFKAITAMHWGTLFEPLIKTYIELELRTQIIGSDLFIRGPPGTSYSPDGLGAALIPDENGVRTPRRVLFEFKCPYSRIPEGAVPVNYLPQVLYGLDILKCVDIGLFAEAVFRRCAWDDLGQNMNHHKAPGARSFGSNSVLACGVIGFYYDQKCFDDRYYAANKKVIAGEKVKHLPKEYPITLNCMNKLYREELVEWGDASNGFMTGDIGDVSDELFKHIMDAFHLGFLKPWYGREVFVASESGEIDIAGLSKDKDGFEQMCRDNGYSNYGVLPWKLFRIDYHVVDRQPGFLDPWLSTIQEISTFMREYTAPENAAIKHNLYADYMQKIGNGFV